MSSKLNLPKLAGMLRTKRGERGLREVAEEIGGVSASTLSRIEQQQVPDLETFFRLCAYLKVAPGEFVQGTEGQPEPSRTKDMPAFIEAHLRADRTLPSDTITALSKMIQLAYNAVESGKLPRAVKTKAA